MRISGILSLFVFCLAASGTPASSLVQGSVALLSASSGVELIMPGNDSMVLNATSMPHYTSGIMSIRGGPSEYLFAQTSNEVDLFFEGPGFFGVERFESMLGTSASHARDLKDQQSRMILNLRKGILVVDSRHLDEASQLILEAPFGRVYGAKALWFIRVDFDQRSGIYDFTIACMDGSVRLKDLADQSYFVYPGQRVAGAGSYLSPAIEVGKHTDQTLDQFEDFDLFRSRYDLSKIDRTALRERMLEIALPAGRSTGLEVKSRSDKTPVVIEYVPRAPEMSPFRGEMRPPSDDQADLF